jgi:hypothetical protein
MKQNKELAKVGEDVGLYPLCGHLITDMAIASLQGENLGKGEDTDMLCVSYSQTDVIGHEWSTRGSHTDEAYLELDKDIARLLKALDNQVGEGNYLLFLTADHGAAHNFQFMKDRKLNGGAWEWNDTHVMEAGKRLSERFGIKKLVIKDMLDYRIILDKESIREQGIDEQALRDAIVEEVQKLPHVSFAFDFKKAATKKEIYDKICEMLFNTILDVNQISYADVLRSANTFKDNIRTDILNGSDLYYKQLSVSSPDKYKNPYSMQGIKGVLLWNAIVEKPDRMEFPAEVDIIPIPFDKFSEKKFAEFLDNPKEFFNNYGNDVKYKAIFNFYTNYHVEFSRMISTMKEHPDIWTKLPSSIAKPRALKELPEWLKSIIDIDTIVHNNVNLINPILESLGIPIINEKLGPMFTTLVSL